MDEKLKGKAQLQSLAQKWVDYCYKELHGHDGTGDVEPDALALDVALARKRDFDFNDGYEAVVILLQRQLAKKKNQKKGR